ncbi:polysaccharide pyruvyl transferase family protein, partial [Brevundimonas sp.]|uniref:polysaccharide pyruvyl transferase family protein n=2 Tax=unclassified Brevundimonas TaxID=2622653 RepID=UPI00289CF2D5
MGRRSQIWHWRQEDEVKNFGDYLADFLSQEMFEPISWHDGPVHVIGSVIADFLVPEADLTEDGQQQPKVVFWGCGVRDENGLSEDRIHRAKILAVRGPKTASVLKLGAATPQGDIAFFLPALYAPRRLRLTAGKSICIPHFWDRRPDGDFADAGCDVVLRTNIAAGPVQIRRVIDSIASADFVLTASLHGAVVAAAYGIPFAFWDNGHVDLPFKWEDFAAYLSIPNTFYTNLSDAKAGYDEEIRDRLKRPPLWAFLACAPFPIKPVAMAKIVGHLWSSSGASEAEATLQDLLDEFEHATVEKDVAANAFMDQVAALNDAVASGRAELARAEEETLRLIRLKDDVGGVADAQEKSLRERDEEIAALKDGLAKVEATHAEFRTSANARVDALEHENASLNDEVEARAG